MSASYQTKLLLAFRSGDICAFPKCQCNLTLDSNSGNDSSIMGEAAHISGENIGAARYNQLMSDDERNHYKNLIYLCRNHHCQIDRQPEDFSVETLLKIKKEHEIKVRESLTAAFSEVGFPELVIATAWVARIQELLPSQDFSVITPDEKIKKNGLTGASQFTIKMGLGVAQEVSSFLKEESIQNTDFPEKLKYGFLEEYSRLYKIGYRGDELFDLMCEFAQHGMKKQSERSAGLAVLIYLFEACEVFEK